MLRAMLTAADRGELDASPGMFAGMAGGLEALGTRPGEAGRLAVELDSRP